MVSVLKTIRNNWKKSAFAAGLIAYGTNLASQKIRAANLLRIYCEEAKVYGDAPISNSTKPRHVTVILNPAARDKKGKKLYDTYCEPLLNLAGIRVSTIMTEEEGQARDLMGIMDNTDAVIIAGGDGTLHEAITGLLRRDDEAVATKKIPIGIAPIGRTNSLAKSHFWKPNMTEPQFLAEATMAVIRELTKPIDVMKIHGSQNKPVYAVANLECGSFRDADNLIPKYWYFGFLKPKVTYLLSSIKNQIKNVDLNIEYTLPCDGCSNCYEKPLEKPQTPVNSKWWGAFVPRVPSVENKQTDIDYSQITNEKCGQWVQEIVECSNFLLSLMKENHAVQARFHKANLSMKDFISEGWSRHSNTQKIEQENDAISRALSFSNAKLEVTVPEGNELWFNIDNENYEAQNISISLIPNKILMYC